MRAAIALALAGGVDPVIAVKFAVALQGFWILRGYATEGRNLVRAALALPAIQASDLAQACALYVGAALAESQSDYAEALQMLETCLALRRGLGNPVDIAATLRRCRWPACRPAMRRARPRREREALQIFRQLGDRVGEAIGLLHLGQIATLCLVDDRTGAFANLERALAIAREIKHQEIEG